MTGYFTRTYEHWKIETTTNSFGEEIETAVYSGDIEGRASPTTRTDLTVGNALTGKVNWRFATAPEVDLQTNDEIRFDGRTLKIRGAAPTSSGRRLEAMCEELTDV